MVHAIRHGMTRRKFLKGVGTATTGWPVVTILWRDGQVATASLGEGQAVRPITLKVNGAVHRLELEPRRILADVIRKELGLTGTKVVCDHASCGACTVLLEGRTVFSCHLLAVQADGQSIETIEGLANGDQLHSYHAILEGGPCYIVHPSDMAPALIALGAQIHLLGSKGPRSLPLEEFFVTTVQRLYQENVLEREEIITALTVPPMSAEMKQVFLKSRIRQADEFSLAAVALAARVQAGTCIDCRVVLGGVAPRPYRAIAAEEAIKGSSLTAEQINKAAAAALADAKPMAMNTYKLDLARGLVVRAFEQVA